jgi:hypothetical protein
MQVTDVRPDADDGFAVEFQQEPEHTMRGRVLRPHVEDHRTVVSDDLDNRFKVAELAGH